MWNKVKEKLPEEEGKYLTYHENPYGYKCNFYSVDSFVFNLNTVDKYEMQKKKAGFYNYDDEYGYYETFPTYWAELPEPPNQE